MTAAAPAIWTPPTQMELLQPDIALDEFHAVMKDAAGIELSSAIIDARVSRTIEGASHIDITVDDDAQRTIQKSGRLGKGVNVKIDGIWWTLVAVTKSSRSLTLTWEEYEVNLLRRYSSLIFADRTKTTRAQFVLRMIKEVKEETLKYIIPELDIVATVQDQLQPGQILVDGTGQPLKSPSVGSGNNDNRSPGFPPDAHLMVKTEKATAEQLNNAAIILDQAHTRKAPWRVQVASIATAITESSIINLYGGDRDSVGVFQQRRSQGWPATRDVATDADEFIRRCMLLNAADPTLPIQMLCQGVQHSKFPDGSNYATWVAQAAEIVAAFGGASTNEMYSGNNMGAVGAAAGANFFMRGQVSKRSHSSAFILTKEDSWDCMQRLAQEVNWRAFCISGTIYYISEEYLFRSKPFMTISEDSVGIDWIDYDYDEGKKKATLTITAHLSRWSAPPGSIISVFDQGLVDGRWLIHDIERSIYESVATITAEKPLPLLPEPVAASSIPKGFSPVPIKKWSGYGTPPEKGARIAAQVVQYAISQKGVPYVWGAEIPGVAFDCSGLTQAAYDSAGWKIPHNAQAQYDSGTRIDLVQLQPGDLVFFGIDVLHITHVGIYIGNGNMIDAPHSGAVVRVESINWGPPEQLVGATRPWL